MAFLVAVTAIALFPARILAFADTAQFLAQLSATTNASAEGIYFTGAPRFGTLTCRDCHTGGPGKMKMQITSDSAELFSTGYQPAKTYVLHVQMIGETLGTGYDGPASCTEPDGAPYVQCNNNGFALEIDDARGPLASNFCAAAPDPSGACPSPAPTDEAWVAPDGDAVFGNRGHDSNRPSLVLRNGPTSWQFHWTAPPAGTGALTLYGAMVDGNGGAGRADTDRDPFGDDVADVRLTLREAGAPSGGSGCSAADPAPLGSAGAVLLLAWLALRRRRA